MQNPLSVTGMGRGNISTWGGLEESVWIQYVLCRNDSSSNFDIEGSSYNSRIKESWILSFESLINLVEISFLWEFCSFHGWPLGLYSSLMWTRQK